MGKIYKVGIMAIILLLLISTTATSIPVDKEKVVKNLLSKKHNIAIDKLEIKDSSPIQLPLTGKTANRYKAIDIINGNVYGIAIDDNGNEVEIQKLLQDEDNAKKAKYGKLDPALSDKLQTSGNQEIGVIVWLEDQSKDKTTKKDYAVDLTTDENFPGIQDPEVVKKLDQAKKDRKINVNAIVDPFSKKMSQKGYKHNVDTSAPVIYAKLKKEQINDVASWAEVDTIYPDAQAVSGLKVARSSIFANTVYGRNIAGFGTKVGEIEVGGGVYDYNPYLAPPSIELDTLNTCLNDHAAAVAGIIRSWHPTYFGIAPGSWLRIGGSCGGWDSELTGAADRAIDWGARVLTNSWWDDINLNGDLHYIDRYFDTVAWNSPYITSVQIAGNSGGRVSSPGLSYNSITVGAFDDKGTTSLSDDAMAPYSGYINGNNYMEKPEVAAPGSNIDSLKNGYPYYGNMGSGTSYAAPMVTGEIADIMQRNTNLLSWPEAVKAIVMASASHNIEGSSELSDKDGAGGITVDRADNIARGYGGRWGGNYYACTFTTPYTLTTMSLTAGVKTRVVMAFSTDPNDPNYDFYPSADLDIQIKGPSGSLIDGSYSSRNTYEIVEFTPTVTGNYKLNLVKDSCASSKYLGWAFYKLT